ncbi:hypothetical protein LZ31DRAFT_547584 [Colletotrichum somersetense]|nr:hypothetical protein LZ31DRAFT_547584 [Colletotrichum somersetense]
MTSDRRRWVLVATDHGFLRPQCGRRILSEVAAVRGLLVQWSLQAGAGGDPSLLHKDLVRVADGLVARFRESLKRSAIDPCFSTAAAHPGTLTGNRLDGSSRQSGTDATSVILGNRAPASEPMIPKTENDRNAQPHLTVEAGDWRIPITQTLFMIAAIQPAPAIDYQLQMVSG